MEKFTKAKFSQSQLLRQSEDVSYQQQVEVDGDEVTLGRDVGFDMAGFDTNVGGSSSAGGC